MHLRFNCDWDADPSTVQDWDADSSTVQDSVFVQDQPYGKDQPSCCISDHQTYYKTVRKIHKFALSTIYIPYTPYCSLHLNVLFS